MDEEIKIIDTKTRNEKLKIFFKENRKLIFSILLLFLITIFGIYSFQIYKNSQRESISDKYNLVVINYNQSDKSKTISSMKEIVNMQDKTYSPLALYFLIDNNLVDNADEINLLFDILINDISFENEIKNLIIYKKALYNADNINESDLLNILSPVINSESIWKSHALFLTAEYFYNQNEKQKSREFFEQILSLENVDNEIKIKAQKRITRDLSE
tara:strand:- start:1171 stop:1815 length:645 start_codon:yes stop_codon:yes gene_type:complete